MKEQMFNGAVGFDELCKSQGYEHTGDDVVATLMKALYTTNSGPGGIAGGPLMLENLDGLMTEVLITQRHFKMLQMFPRIPSAQPYFEWNRHKGFGSRRGSLGFAEGGAPKGGISAFERNGIYNKYLGVKGGVTHQMLITGQNGGSFEDPTARENKDRSLELFERMERESVFGNKSLKDENGNEVHFDGLLALLETLNAANVIDKEGDPLTYDDLDDTSSNLVKVGKQISVDGYTAMMSPHVTQGINKQYQERNVVRHNKDSAGRADYVPGFKVPGYDGQFGFINFDHSILLEEVEDSAPLDAAISGAPAAPDSVTPLAAANAASKMEAGTYYYSVAAFNDTGESLPAVSAGEAVTAGQEVGLTIARVTNATGYRVYRGKLADGSDAKWIGRVPQTASGDVTFTDTNGWRTLDADGKEENGLAIIMKPDPADLCLSQMTPLIKMPLPQVDTTFPFLLLLYCALVLKAPERLRIYKNCGSYVPA